MYEHDSNFELPNKMDNCLATLSKLYGRKGARQLREIIVNARHRVHEEWSSDSWDGGTYGHALYLLVPETIYLNIVEDKVDIQNQIKNELNQLHHVQNEFIAEVFIELEDIKDQEWRRESGLLIGGKRVVPTDAERRIWGGDGFRVFLSHRSDVKQSTARLKDRLQLFGISAFVAHKDISPTREWQDEIENALASMDAFAALMTPEFHESDWTDQEVGFALCRGVPIIPVNLGRNPYGFFGKFQALVGTWETAPENLAGILIKHDKMFSAYVQALRNCPSWTSGNELAYILPSIERLNPQQISDLVAAYNNCYELRGSFGFNGNNPRSYGTGLIDHLHRFGPRRFRYAANFLIEEVEAQSL
jgi:hypothetical protein